MSKQEKKQEDQKTSKELAFEAFLGTGLLAGLKKDDQEDIYNRLSEDDIVKLTENFEKSKEKEELNEEKFNQILSEAKEIGLISLEDSNEAEDDTVIHKRIKSRLDAQKKKEIDAIIQKTISLEDHDKKMNLQKKNLSDLRKQVSDLKKEIAKKDKTIAKYESDSSKEK